MIEEIAESIEDIEMIELVPGTIDDPNEDSSINPEILNNSKMNRVLLENNKRIEGRCTLPYLTKYEKARILGARALQISMGAPLMIDEGIESDPLDIASRELMERKIPINIRRYLPKGFFEDWKIEEMILE